MQGFAPLDAAVQLGRVVPNAAIDRRVVHRQMAFGHHLIKFTIVQRITAVPAQAKQDDIRREMSAFERQAYAARSRL